MHIVNKVNRMQSRKKDKFYIPILHNLCTTIGRMNSCNPCGTPSAKKKMNN